jgi:hypothetical protein
VDAGSPVEMALLVAFDATRYACPPPVLLPQHTVKDTICMATAMLVLSVPCAT